MLVEDILVILWFPLQINLNSVTAASATAAAVVSAAGTISNVYLTNAGLGYSFAPTISIASPTGGSNTGASCSMVILDLQLEWLQELDLGILLQMFLKLLLYLDRLLEETLAQILGQQNSEVIDKTIDNDPYADNFDIETEADAILASLSRTHLECPK